MFRRFRFPLALKNGSTYFLVFALLGALGCFQNPQQAKKRYFESGQGYFAQKKYHEAVNYFRNSAFRTPDSALFVAPPRIFKAGEDWILKLVRSCDADGYLIRNYDHLRFFANEPRVGEEQ